MHHYCGSFWCDLKHEWRDLEQMWSCDLWIDHIAESQSNNLVPRAFPNQIAGITSGFKMHIIEFQKKEKINNTPNMQPSTIMD